ncbi:hypothetical protein [Lysobacter sp. N42]|uniref:hypothetical protein n=1 Tax=Lysobacter sp. N42 TaxID=2545719 RepID=UPI001044A353|nr:hypothetical protein [Lysobacter sp. N42]TCZ89093.1 hypothetical protein EYQ95_13090 [Lysobacter sp. N42]
MRTTDPGAVGHAPPLPHQPALDHARKIALWVGRALPVPPQVRRSRPALALHHQVIEHHMGVVALAEAHLFAPMLSLVRPMVDRHLRALWVERLSVTAIESFLTGPDTPDIEALLRLLRKASRLGESDALLAAWERSPLFHHPALMASGEDAGAGRAATVHLVPTLDDVVDGLNFSTGLALLSTMRMAQLTGDAGTEQSARFRFGVMPGIGR